MNIKSESSLESKLKNGTRVESMGLVSGSSTKSESRVESKSELKLYSKLRRC